MSLSRSSAIPRSALTTMAATRRSVLRGMALSGLAVGGANLLAACGGDDSGPATGSGATVKFGINEAEGSGPAYDRLKAMADAYTQETDTKVDLNAVDHNTFQESINTYLQGTPDDVFTWFAGFRMAQFAEAGLITAGSVCEGASTARSAADAALRTGTDLSERARRHAQAVAAVAAYEERRPERDAAAQMTSHCGMWAMALGFVLVTGLVGHLGVGVLFARLAGRLRDHRGRGRA